MARIVENWVVSILILLDVLLQRGIVVTRDYRNDLFQSLFYWMFYFNTVDQAPVYPREISFNPYFTGCSTSTKNTTPEENNDLFGFNPYFTGCSTSTGALW